MRHSHGLARTLSSGHQLTTRPNGLKVQFSHARAAPLALLRAADTVQSQPLPILPRAVAVASTIPTVLGGERRLPSVGKSLYLNDPAGRRHLAAHHDPREGAASGALASCGDHSSSRRLGNGPWGDVTEEGQAGGIRLHCGGSPTSLCLTPPHPS